MSSTVLCLDYFFLLPVTSPVWWQQIQSLLTSIALCPESAPFFSTTCSRLWSAE